MNYYISLHTKGQIIMYTKKEPVTVEKEVYYSDDGHRFESQSACENYERRKNGTRKSCDRCHGLGFLIDRFIPETKHHDSTGEWTSGGYHETCPVCHGKGYLDKHVVTTESWD
jgi:DnaJ-class molecular chaperone